MKVQDYYIDGEFDWEGFYEELSGILSKRLRGEASIEYDDSQLKLELEFDVRQTGAMNMNVIFDSDSFAGMDGNKISAHVEFVTEITQPINPQLGMGSNRIADKVEDVRGDWRSLEAEEDGDGFITEITATEMSFVDMYPVSMSADVSAAGDIYANTISGMIDGMYSRATDLQDIFWQR